MNPKRIDYLDVARAIAIISITINHAVNRSFAVYHNSQAEYQQIPVLLSGVKVILFIFSRIVVPLFLMISGALLLPRDYSQGVGRFFKHNWLQLLITTEYGCLSCFGICNWRQIPCCIQRGSDSVCSGLL